MSNEIEIRIGSKDNSGPGFASANANQAKLSAAMLATRKTALSLAEANDKVTAAQARAKDVAGKLAREELTEAEAARQATQAARDLERAQIAQITAAKAAAAASHNLAREQHQAGAEATGLERLASRAFTAIETTSTRAFERVRSGGRRAFREVGLEGTAMHRVLSSGLDKIGAVSSRAFSMVGSAGTSAFEGIMGAAGSLAEMGPAIPIAIGVALMALTPIAVAVGGAITLGIGGAFAALGVMAFAKTAEMKAVFGGLKSYVGSELRNIADPIRLSMLNAAKVGKTAFQGLEPTLKSMFAQMGPALTDFTNRFGGSLSKLRPAFASVGDAFSKILNELGPQMPVIMGNIATGIQAMAQTASEHAKDFVVLIAAISLLVRGFGDLIHALASAGGYLKWLNPITGAAIALADHFGLSSARLADNHTLAAAAAGNLGAQTQAATSAMQLSAAAAAVGGSVIYKAASAMNTAALSAELMKAQLDALTSGTLNSREGMRAYEAAVDALSASIKKNGKTTDIGTAKGRDNQAALDAIAKSGLAAAESLKSVDSTGGATARQLQKTRDAVYRAALALGQSKTQADRTATALTGVTRAANTIPSSKKTNVSAGVNGALAGIGRVKSYLASLHDRVVNVLVHSTVQGAQLGAGAGGGGMTGGVIGGVGRYASGGVASGSALALVGEAGRELVRLPYGSTVIPNGQTEQMLGEDGEYDIDDSDGYATGGVVSRRRKRRRRHPRVREATSGPREATGHLPWGKATSPTKKKKAPPMVTPPPHVPYWWHGQSNTSFGPGSAHFMWGGPRPDNVDATPVPMAAPGRPGVKEGVATHSPAWGHAEVKSWVKEAVAAHRPVIEIRSDGSAHADYLISELRKAIRTRGGDVQVVLGK